MGQLFDPIHGPVVAIGPYYFANLDTALTNTDMLLQGTAGVTLAPGMPSAGTIVGLSISNNGAAPSAGTATFSVHSAGTEVSGGPTAVIDSVTNTVESSGLSATVRAHTFAKGARLGVSATTTTNLAATTLDYSAYIWVRFDQAGGALA